MTIQVTKSVKCIILLRSNSSSKTTYIIYKKTMLICIKSYNNKKVFYMIGAFIIFISNI